MAVFVIRLYQLLNSAKVSLLMSAFGYVSVCHHQPKCSEYTLEQIKKHGTMLGLWRGSVRIITCW